MRALVARLVAVADSVRWTSVECTEFDLDLRQ